MPKAHFVLVTNDQSLISPYQQNQFQELIKKMSDKVAIGTRNMDFLFSDSIMEFTIQVSDSIEALKLKELLTHYSEFAFHEAYDLNQTYEVFANIHQSDQSLTASESDTSLPKLNDYLFARDRNINSFSPRFWMFCNPKDTAMVNNLISINRKKGLIPYGMRFMWGQFPEKNDGFFSLYPIKRKSKNNFRLNGHVLQSEIGNPHILLDDSSVIDDFNITLSFDDYGSKAFQILTANNINNVLILSNNGVCSSAPTVYNEISNGKVSINGGFNKEEAELLSNSLRFSAIPASMKLKTFELIPSTSSSVH